MLLYLLERTYPVPSKELRFFNMPENVESIFVEINLFKAKWLVCGCYHPQSQNNQYFFNHLGNALDNYTESYDRFFLQVTLMLTILNHVYQNFFIIIVP